MRIIWTAAGTAQIRDSRIEVFASRENLTVVAGVAVRRRAQAGTDNAHGPSASARDRMLLV
jgi:hypothetical protein